MNYLRRSRCGMSLVTGLWLCAILIALPGNTAPFLDSLPTIDTIRSRLELTPEQEAQLRPIFEARKSELQRTKSRLQQASTPKEERDALLEAEIAGDAFNAQVEGLLTPSQKSEWREIISQLRDKAEERIEEKRDSR